MVMPSGRADGENDSGVLNSTQRARVSVIASRSGASVALADLSEPGMAETEFTIVRTGGDRQASDKLYAGVNPMTAADLADLFWWLANLPPHLNINIVELMPVSQSFAGFTVTREA